MQEWFYKSKIHFFFFFKLLSQPYDQCGARTHDYETRRRTCFCLSRPDASKTHFREKCARGSRRTCAQRARRQGWLPAHPCFQQLPQALCPAPTSSPLHSRCAPGRPPAGLWHPFQGAATVTTTVTKHFTATSSLSASFITKTNTNFSSSQEICQTFSIPN